MLTSSFQRDGRQTGKGLQQLQIFLAVSVGLVALQIENPDDPPLGDYRHHHFRSCLHPGLDVTRIVLDVRDDKAPLRFGRPASQSFPNLKMKVRLQSRIESSGLNVLDLSFLSIDQKYGASVVTYDLRQRTQDQLQKLA